jgi:KUP system potassium uptake protein
MAVRDSIGAAASRSIASAATGPNASHEQTHAGAERFPALALAAIGTVYGDIGTSPLYTIREAFGETGRLPLTESNVLGVLSLVFWALILVVTIKYIAVVLRADNQGEGGIMALSALAQEAFASTRGKTTVAILAMIGTGLFFGDGVITPAISVLGAVEGLEVVAPTLRHLVVPIALALLIALFLPQRRGTGVVGRWFGPIMLVWFGCIAILGLCGIARNPVVLAALNPAHAAQVFFEHRWGAFFALAAIVLAITGVEAIYADLGHFGRKPIRAAWLFPVLPALVLNYFGQGALLLQDPRAIANPFYLLAPSWAWYPLLFVATLATIIASQAVISGAFSMARQAINLGYLPRLQIRHTSEQEIGQVYVPAMNWLLACVVALVVLGFGSSSALAGAYGIAVTGTLMITSVLAYKVARRRWNWPRRIAIPIFGTFLLIDAAFFASNVPKIPHGGWFPLGLGGLAVLIMATWRKGRRVLAARRSQAASSLHDFVTWIEGSSVTRVPGSAVFLTADPDTVPSSLLHNLKHNKVLHERVIILTVRTEDIPRVSMDRRMSTEAIGSGFYSLILRYGFFETPDLPRALSTCRGCGAPFDIMQTSFFLSREKLLPRPGRDLNAIEERVFVALNHSALDATEFFCIPPNRVIEVGTQMEL